MTIPARTALSRVILAALVFAPATLQAQDAPVKLTGRCERLVIDGQDITQNCKEQLVSLAARGRASFDFSAWDGQFVSFAGAEGEAAGRPLPVTLVVPGRKEKDAILRNPAPASGACTLSTPEAGKTMIACEASAQGKTYRGTFVTDQPLPGAAGKP